MTGVIYADEAEDLGYKPPHDFVDFAKKSVVDIELTDSTELWLIQWPNNQQPNFDGQELSLDLHQDGQLGSFEDSSGKTYDMVSFSSHEPDAHVFLPSTSESNVVGKISRRVSLIHYPDPKEQEVLRANNLRELSEKSSKSNVTSHHFATPTRSIKPSSSSRPTSTQSHRTKSSLSELVKPPKSAKRPAHSNVSSASKHSGEGKPKKIRSED